MYSDFKNQNGEFFNCYVLQYCENLQQLDKCEEYWIDFSNTVSPHGYNRIRGGRAAMIGVPKTQEHRQKISKGHTGKKVSQKILDILSHHNKLRSISEEEKALREKKKLENISKFANPETYLLSSMERRKKVRCIETGEVYESIADCARKIKTTRSCLQSHLRKRKHYNTIKKLTYEKI